MNKIIIIGTQPPCPRCKLLTEIVTNISETIGLSADIRYISYTSDESAQYAHTVGLVPGTAKDVAKKVGIEINWGAKDVIPQKYNKQIRNLDQNLKPLESLFKEVAILDNRLRTFENMAREVGIMMTPVLIINDEIKHQGSLPWVLEIEEWLFKLTE